VSFKPTDQQLKAIRSIEKDTAVTAGAGSGKTKVLVERYIHLLNEGFTVDQIAAITFTKKAAQEMKDRIRQALPELQDLVESAQISTIHSLCQRIVFEHPREAGIDPRCRVAEEWEADALLARVISDVLSICELDEEFRTSSEAVDLIYEIYRQMLGRGDLNFDQDHPIPDVCGEVQELCWTVEEFLVEVYGYKPTQNKLEVLSELKERWPAIKLDLTSMDEVFIEDGLESLEGFLGGNWGKLKVVVEPVRERIKGVRQVLRERQGSVVLKQIGEILAEVHKRFSQLKKKNGLLDFNDLELLAARLLANSEVVKSYDFRHIMVDEFQDTNPLQKQIVDSLCSEGAKLFVVGDPKQSIYRFRGAEVEVFMETHQAIEESGRVIPLGDNFRSRSEIIEFTNEFFKELMKEDPIGYTPSNPRRESTGKPMVHLLVTEVEDLSLEEARQLEAEQIALQIQALVGSGSYNYKDISLLFRTRTNMRSYERALQAAGVPYVNLSGRGFYSRQEVQDILNYFAWLEDEGDNVAKLAVLRSPFYKVSDDGLFWEQQGSRESMSEQDRCMVLKAEADRAVLAELVRTKPAPYVMQEMLERTDYINTIACEPFGEQKAANVQKLLQQSWDLLVRGHVSCADQLQYIAAVRSRSDDESEAQLDAEYADVVTIRTVHGAKGLEFPVVFVPDTNGRLTRNRGDLVLYHPKIGLAYKGTELYNTVEERNTLEELSEARRLLYVAVTRAEEELYICGIDGASSSGSWWEWICGILPSVPSTLYDRVPLLKGEPRQEQLPLFVPEVLDAEAQLAAAVARPLEPLPPLAPSYSQVSFSVTALMVYDRCPRCYYLRYILGIPEQLRGPKKQAASGRATSLTAIQRGNIVHRVCERITHPHELDELIEFAAASEGVDLTPSQRHDIERIVRPYLESPFFHRARAGGEFYREYDFTLPLDGSGTHFVINGTVDQVFVDDAGLEIVDFKSNWIAPEQVESEGEKYRWQLRTYAWAMAKLFDRPVTRSQAYFLIPNQVFALQGAELDLRAIETEIATACRQIIAGEQVGPSAFPSATGCTDCLRWEE